MGCLLLIVLSYYMLAQEIIFMLAQMLQPRQRAVLVRAMAEVPCATATVTGVFEPYHIAGLALQNKLLPEKAHANDNEKAGDVTRCHDKMKC